MKHQIPFRIILRNAPAGIDFGIQKGKGVQYETIQIQKSTNKEMLFELSLQVIKSADGSPNFSGPLAQGNSSSRFIYIDIGASAGQKNTC